MREILFRGKRKDNGKWEYGDLVDGVGGTFVSSKSIHRFPCIHRDTIGQFTGVFDNNGNKLFEGDIISVLVEPSEFNKSHFCITDECRKLAVIKYSADDTSFLFEFIKDESGLHPCYETPRLCDCDFYVVGNIHDNPELIKED